MQEFSTEYKTRAVFPCKICHDSDGPTPLEYAFGMLSVFDIDTRMELVGRVAHDLLDPNKVTTWFGEGWLAGMEGDNKGEMPWAADDRLDIQAWTVGYLAARYAAPRDFDTPVCKYPDTAEHGKQQ